MCERRQERQRARNPSEGGKFLFFLRMAGDHAQPCIRHAQVAGGTKFDATVVGEFRCSQPLGIMVKKIIVSPCGACSRKGYDCVDRTCKTCAETGIKVECTHLRPSGPDTGGEPHVPLTLHTRVAEFETPRGQQRASIVLYATITVPSASPTRSISEFACASKCPLWAHPALLFIAAAPFLAQSDCPHDESGHISARTGIIVLSCHRPQY